MSEGDGDDAEVANKLNGGIQLQEYAFAEEGYGDHDPASANSTAISEMGLPLDVSPESTYYRLTSSISI